MYYFGDREEEARKDDEQMRKWDIEQLEAAQRHFYTLKPSTKKARRLEHRKRILKLKYKTQIYNDWDPPF